MFRSKNTISKTYNPIDEVRANILLKEENISKLEDRIKEIIRVK